MSEILRFEIYLTNGDIHAFRTRGERIVSPMEVLDSIVREKRLKREDIKSIKLVEKFSIPEKDIRWD